MSALRVIRSCHSSTQGRSIRGMSRPSPATATAASAEICTGPTNGLISTASCKPRPWSRSLPQDGPRNPGDLERRSRCDDSAMSDETIAARIESLVEEEHSLLGREQADVNAADQLDDDRQRLDQIAVE